MAYIKNKVLAASPAERLLMTYDAILLACRNHDKGRARVAIRCLIETLDFEQNSELALGLHRLYTYCIEQINSGSFEEAAGIISELRDAWEKGAAQSECLKFDALKHAKER